MENKKVYLSIDLGASSGRVMAGQWDGSTLRLSEVHRFPTPSVFVPPYHYWDILAIYSSILHGLNTARQAYGGQIVSIGVDSWGVDYALIDANGELLANPIQYRDERTQKTFAQIPDQLGRETLYRETGIQFLFFNTIYQLAAEVAESREVFQKAKHLLFIPDLINFWLSGKRIQERTIASTSQLLNPHTGTWSPSLIEALGLPAHLFGAITDPGTTLGALRPDLAEDLRMPDVRVIAVPGHDTASAVAATPFASERSAFLSSGTWSIMGRELPAPNTSAEAMDAGMSNELGYGGTVRFLRNICGMWLIEESRRQWAREGHDYYTHDAIAEMVCEVPARRAFIDPDAPEFASPGDIPSRITQFCQRTGQEQPTSPAEVLRIAFDSLVMKYRYVFKKLETLGSTTIDRLHIVGGGAKNDFLNQMTADALGVEVEAGPTEATSLGNIAAQMIADRALPDLSVARSVIQRSFPTTVHKPGNSQPWIDAEQRFNQLLS